MSGALPSFNPSSDDTLTSTLPAPPKQDALTDNGNPDACISNTTTKLLDIKTCAKLPKFEPDKDLKLRTLHHFEFPEDPGSGSEDPVVARVRTQWLAPPTGIRRSTVNEYLQDNPSARYTMGTKVLLTCVSSNSSRTQPSSKRARSALEPSATEEALAQAAEDVVKGQVIAFYEDVPTMVDLPEGFSPEDRKEILQPKAGWAAKLSSKPLVPMPPKIKAELRRLHSFAGHHVSAAKVHTDLMRTAGWLARSSVDLARIKQFFNALTTKNKKKLSAAKSGEDAEAEEDDVGDLVQASIRLDNALREVESKAEPILGAEE